MASWLPCQDSGTGPLPAAVPGVPPAGGVPVPQPDQAPSPTMPQPLVSSPSLGLSLCRGSYWVSLPQLSSHPFPLQGPACPVHRPWAAGGWSLPPWGLTRGAHTSPSPLGRKPGQSLLWSPTWGQAKPGQAGNITLEGCRASAPTGSKPNVLVMVVAPKGSRVGGRGPGRMLIASWQTQAGIN